MVKLFHCRLSQPDARRIMDGLMKGINYIHVLDIVHRDVKPENILITNGKPVLADFGGSTKMEGKRIRGQVGSTLYMAPEIIMDMEYDEKVDLWSCGM